ncbi:hypothetical protein L9F63_013492, partial [Diploptera punctata]
ETHKPSAEQGLFLKMPRDKLLKIGAVSPKSGPRMRMEEGEEVTVKTSTAEGVLHHGGR